ncbi:MAG: hypothetical protein V1750_04605 [Acidobacteriota bacterium]
MRHLGGSRGWRPFVLPFQGRPGAAPPAELVINLVLPAAGRVGIGRLELVQHRSAAGLLALPGQWFGGRAGWVGGILGTALGLAGALLGLLSARGASRRAVLGLAYGMLASGALLVAAGMAAVATSQPSGIWYSLLLPGVVCVVVVRGLLPALHRRYRELELRRMRSLDAR